MNWATPGGNFRFGNLSSVQQALFEDKPDLAYQNLMNWWGQGNSGFENTVFGRFLQSQQQKLFNNYINAQAANPTGGLTWTNWLENNAGNMGQQFQALPSYMRGVNPGLYRTRRELW